MPSLYFCWPTKDAVREVGLLFNLVFEIETYGNLLTFQDFKNGKVDTAFIPKHEEELKPVSFLPDSLLSYSLNC